MAASTLVLCSLCGYISPVNQTTTTLLRRRPSNDLQSHSQVNRQHANAIRPNDVTSPILQISTRPIRPGAYSGFQVRDVK